VFIAHCAVCVLLNSLLVCTCSSLTLVAYIDMVAAAAQVDFDDQAYCGTVLNTTKTTFKVHFDADDEKMDITFDRHSWRRLD
jgi:hypothetical protein